MSSQPKWEITKITKSPNTKRTYGKPNYQVFPQKVATQLTKPNKISPRHIEVENSTENELHVQVYHIITPPTLSHYNIVSLITQSFLWTEKTVLE